MSLLQVYEEDQHYNEEERCLNKETVQRLLTSGKTRVVEAVREGCDALLDRYCIETTEWPSLLQTHIKDLDYLLNGGLPVIHITEICGLPDVGKTQLAYTISANISRIDKNNVIYVDTKGDFSATKIEQILFNNCKDETDIANCLDRIKVINVWNMSQLIKFLHGLKKDNSLMEKVSIIIVDSLPALMLQHQGQRFKNSIGLLNHFVNVARYLSWKFKIAIVVINLFTRWVEGTSFGEIAEQSSSNNFKDTSLPILGKYWQFIPYLRLDVVKENVDRADIKIKIRTRNYDNANNMTLAAKIDDKGIIIE